MFLFFLVFHIESEVSHIKIIQFQALQFKIQLFLVPLCRLGYLVIGKTKSFDLLRRKIIRHDTWNRLSSKLFCCLISRMSADDHPVLVNHNRNLEAKFADAVCNKRNRFFVPSRIVLVWNKLFQVLLNNLHSQLHRCNFRALQNKCGAIRRR